MHTSLIREAVMDRHGRKSQIKTFIHDSAVICERTPDLGLLKNQADDEVKRGVKVSMIPLQWI